MNKVSLLILAGGFGSRYKGQKQIDSVSENDETLMEYGLYDALKVGIRKFVFIANSHFPEEYRKHLIQILQKNMAEIHFVEQTVEKFVPTEFLPKLSARTQPLGTAHAVYCAKEMINEPFITMNADDFYGFQSFKLAYDFISNSSDDWGMVAFELENTLSENGGVSRGICTIENDFLENVEEFVQIQKTENEIFGIDENQNRKILSGKEKVSMNFWILQPEIFGLIQKDFQRFLMEQKDLSQKEFYLPSVIDKAIQEKSVRFEVLKTTEKWFGLTYQEDKKFVKEEIRKRKTEKIYPEKLWTSTE